MRECCPKCDGKEMIGVRELCCMNCGWKGRKLVQQELAEAEVKGDPMVGLVLLMLIIGFILAILFVGLKLLIILGR